MYEKLEILKALRCLISYEPSITTVECNMTKKFNADNKTGSNSLFWTMVKRVKIRFIITIRAQQDVYVNSVNKRKANVLV